MNLYTTKHCQVKRDIYLFNQSSVEAFFNVFSNDLQEFVICFHTRVSTK